MFDKIKKIKSHQFKTTIYESKIEFDHKKLMGLIDYENLENVGYMKTTYFKEKNILLFPEFKFLLDSCQTFYGQVAKENNYTSWNILS